MDAYVAARSDVYFTGHDGYAAVEPHDVPERRPLCLRHVHRLDVADRSCRQQLDVHVRPHRRVSAARRTWAPTSHGRRHPSAPWLTAGREASDNPTALTRGRKLVVQMVETFGEKMAPTFVEKLDSLDDGEAA